MSEHLLHEARIRDGLTLRRLGGPVRIVEETPSTNDLVLTAGEDGAVVLAEFQTAGRGRQGRRWLSPRGASVLCSIAVHGRRDETFRRRLALAVPVAICEAIVESTEIVPAVCWPNDVYIGERKVSGVLIESRPISNDCAAYAVGVGINCLQHASHFPPELRPRATSLELESPHHVDRHRVIRSLLARLDDWLADEQFMNAPALIAAWNEWSSMIGRRVCLMQSGELYEGVAVEVDVDAGLVVQLDTGGRRLFDGDTTSVVERVAQNTGASEWPRRNHATASRSPETR